MCDHAKECVTQWYWKSLTVNTVKMKGGFLVNSDDRNAIVSGITPWMVWTRCDVLTDPCWRRAAEQSTFGDAYNVLWKERNLRGMMHLYTAIESRVTNERMSEVNGINGDNDAIGYHHEPSVIDGDSDDSEHDDDSEDTAATLEVLEDALTDARIVLTRWEAEYNMIHLKHSLETLRWYSRGLWLMRLHLSRQATMPLVIPGFWVFVQDQLEWAVLAGDEDTAGTARALIALWDRDTRIAGKRPGCVITDKSTWLRPPARLW